MRALTAERRVAEQLEHVRAISRDELDAKQAELDEHVFKLARTEREIDAEIKRRRAAMEKEEKELESRIAAFDALRERIGNGSELIGRAWAEYKNALAANQARALKKKSHPAPAAAKAVKEKGHELAEAVRRARAAEWIVELYEWHLPWLTELGEMRESEAYVERDQEKDPDRDDPVSD